MLDDRDRIFTNLYGLHSARLPAAEARGAWNDIKRLMEMSRLDSWGDPEVGAARTRRRRLSHGPQVVADAEAPG